MLVETTDQARRGDQLSAAAVIRGTPDATTTRPEDTPPATGAHHHSIDDTETRAG